MKSVKLSDDEKSIENQINDLQPVTGEKRERIENIIDQSKKNKSISMRISNFDLEKLKEKAIKEGVPYQTLINSILHKYITDQLFEKEQVLRSFELVSKR